MSTFSRWRSGELAKGAAANPVLEFLERFGYVVRGLLYGVMGLLALGLALGVGGGATDPSGSVMLLARGPFGRLVLITIVVGLSAYSVWGFVRAIFDPLHRGSDPEGMAQRVGFLWSGIAYAALVMFALNLIAGNGKATSGDTVQTAVRSILTYPAGHLLAVVIGALAVGAGIAQFVEARRALFKRDMKREEMTLEERKLADFLGRFGMFSRGVVFTLVGLFVLQAGLRRDPSGAHGYVDAFVFILNQPYGHLLLAIVALGFVALGLHSLAMARWGRLLGSRG